MKQKLREFIDNCLRIKARDESATQIPLKGNWKQFNYYASFGKGAFAYVPWLGFFGFNQIATKGIYPVILYNTKSNNLNLEVCYGVSATSAPGIYWNVKFTQNLRHSNTSKYTQSFVKKSYTINSMEDLDVNIEDILQQISLILDDFNEQFSDNTNSVEKLRTELLKHYEELNFNIDDTPNDYTAIKNEKNIAEVHRVNSKNTKFRVIVNYDKLTENLRDNCKRVPDSYGWTLNGECWVTSRSSLKDVIRKIDSTLDNLTKNNFNKLKKYWIYQPREQGRLWDDVYQNSIIAIGWEELGDLNQYKTKEDLAKSITNIYSKKSYSMNDTLANWEFVNVMDIGDIVYVKKGLDEYLIGRGIVQSDYYFDDTRKEYKSVRKIKWTHNGIYNVDFN